MMRILLLKRLILINCFLIISFSWNQVKSQPSYFYDNADSLARVLPALNKTIDISVAGVSMQEFLRSVANAAEINMNVDPALELTVVNNFKDVSVKNILLFLERNYPIEIITIGNILNINKKEKQVQTESIHRGVSYDSASNLVTIDYFQTDITQVTREITKITHQNIILSPSAVNKKVSGFIKTMPLKSAIEQLAYSNDLILKTTSDGYFILESKPVEATEPASLKAPSVQARNKNTQQNIDINDIVELKVTKSSHNTLSVISSNAPLKEVVKRVSDEFGVNYFIGTELTGTVSMNYQDINYDYFLEQAFISTPFVYRKENNIYLIGKHEQVDFKDFKIYQFQNRTITQIIEIIPADLKEGLLLVEYNELNSILASGVSNRLDKLIKFLSEIDRSVPVILIEVIIVDVNRNYTISSGIDAGVGTSPVESKGQILPKLDLQVGADHINKTIEKLEEFGIINLGNLNTNFYIGLKAFEEQGILNVKSTPKLATLNSHSAILTIGNTEYYLEEQSNYIGSQNPSLSTTQIYKPINAELMIKIRPVVSGDDQITLEIEVGQSDFTERISKTAPPGQ
jgi:type IV pilus assembly protein PilQ